MKTKKLINALVLIVLSVVMSVCAAACSGGAKYTVTLDANGGTIAGGQTSVTVTLNKNYTLPTPTKAGYNFEGWMQGTSPIATTGKWTIESDISVKANWSIRTYNIALDVNGGDALTETALTANLGDYVQLPTPTKAGYTFGGWMLNGEVIGDGVITWSFDDDATLVAKWVGSTTQVTISANGGQGLVDAVVTATRGEVLTLPTLTKTGYTFAGWLVNEQPYDATAAWSIDAPTAILVAQWTANQYTVTLDVNGGNAIDPNTVTVTYGEAFTLPAVTKTGYQVEKWLLSGTQTEVDLNEGWAIADNATIVATWATAQTVVTFDVNGGNALDASAQTATFVYGETVVLPTTTKTGYNLVGWKLNQTVYTNASAWDVDAYTATLVAEWEAKTIPVTFNVKNGAAVTATTFTYGEAPYATASDIPTTTKAFCEFGGWLYNGAAIDLTAPWMLDVANIELVVNWIGTETTVTVKYGVAGVADEEVTVLYGDVFDFSYERDGYILTKFVLENTETEVQVSGSEWAYTEDKTIVAVWTAKTVNLTIKDHEGNTLTTEPIVVTYDAPVNLIAYVPTEGEIEVGGVIIPLEKSIFVDGVQKFFDGFKLEGGEFKITSSFAAYVWDYDGGAQDIVLVLSYESEEIWV